MRVNALGRVNEVNLAKANASLLMVVTELGKLISLKLLEKKAPSSIKLRPSGITTDVIVVLE
jgi:hypothetical protein